nr:gustatory receptor 36 [Papilio machaon]
MKILKSFRFLFIIGNVLLLFRNVSFMSRRNRCFVYFVILLDVLLGIGYIGICIYFKMYFRFADIIFVNLLLINSTLIIFLSCYHAENFKKMLTFLESNNDFINKDDIYLKNYGTKNIIFTVALIAYVVMKITLTMFHTKYSSFDNGLLFYVNMYVKLYYVFSDFRYVYEYIFMCAILYKFSEQLESVIRSIVKHKRFVAPNFQLTTTRPNEFLCKQYVEKISEWFQALTHITEAIKLFKTIFGLQLAVMLTSGTFYISLFLYDIASFSIKHDYENVTIVMSILRLVVTIFLVFVLSRAGQRLLNNVQHLRRRIGKLYILSLVDEKFHDVTKDILEYISSGQMRIQAFGSIDVDMRLLPTFIMVITSYTILALQFNNVL